MGRHRRRARHLGPVLLALLVVVIGAVLLTAETLGEPRGASSETSASPSPAEASPIEASPTGAAVAPSPYEGVGTWLSRYRFTREFGGPAPPVAPADVDAMADAGVRTLYLQPAADDPRFPGLLSSDLLGEFLVRAHARGMQVVAWYLPHFTDVDGDLRRLQEMLDFRASGEGFDAVAVDIEFTEDTELGPRKAALVELSRRLREAAPDVVLGAIVLPPVVTDLLNPGYWPDFPWAEISDVYDVWLPMAYWSNRTEPEWSDPYRYVSENVARLRAHLGDECAVVSVVGGFDAAETAADYAEMARAAGERGAVGVSIYDWPTTPAEAWPAVTGYAGGSC
ncbi:hypothetical protein [Geodermatophilus sp. URMC 64]